MRPAVAVIGTVPEVGVQPRSWARPVRNAFTRQILAVGVEPLWFVGAVALTREMVQTRTREPALNSGRAPLPVNQADYGPA